MPAPSPLPTEVRALARRFDAAVFEAQPGLEEVCVDGAAAVAAALAFLAARLRTDAQTRDQPRDQARDETRDQTPGRLVAVTAPPFWLGERGRPYWHGLRGLGVSSLLVATARTETETLWALEEILRSGAAALAVGAVEGASLVATRRLDMLARETGAVAALVRTTPARNLSAARRRWRLSPAPSAADPWDAKAPGRPRWRATLERSRDGASGETLLEYDDEAFRLHLVDGLADHGLAVGAAARREPSGRIDHIRAA